MVAVFIEYFLKFLRWLQQFFILNKRNKGQADFQQHASFLNFSTLSYHYGLSLYLRNALYLPTRD